VDWLGPRSGIGFDYQYSNFVKLTKRGKMN